MRTHRSAAQRALLDVLIDVRKKAGLTQRQLAALLKRTQSYIDRIESGDQIPDALECRLWAAACRITPWSFWWQLEMRIRRHP